MAEDLSVIPPEEEWGDWASDLDSESAHNSFIGKSPDQAKTLFRASILGYGEELRHMAAVPFRFYMLVFSDHVLSLASSKDEPDAADGANCLIGLIETQVRNTRADIQPILSVLLDSVSYLSKHQEEYGATAEIYGSFAEREARIRAWL